VVSSLGLAAAFLPGSSASAYLSLSYEGNFPTWYASVLLLGFGLLCAGAARRAPADRAHWLGLAILFAFLSLDEATELHEHLAGLVGTGGVLTFDWVVPASVVLLLLGALYLPFLRRLPQRLRTRLLVAAATFVFGALVMELPLGWWVARHGDDGLGYALIDWVEETLELVGSSLAVVALAELPP
jgi:hypothetical protein